VLFYTNAYNDVRERIKITITIHHLCCEYLSNPLGIDVITPRLSRQFSSEQKGTVQTGYQIQVSDDKDLLWDTGKVISDQSIQVPYDGSILVSG